MEPYGDGPAGLDGDERGEVAATGRGPDQDAVQGREGPPPVPGTVVAGPASDREGAGQQDLPGRAVQPLRPGPAGRADDGGGFRGLAQRISSLGTARDTRMSRADGAALRASAVSASPSRSSLSGKAPVPGTRRLVVPPAADGPGGVQRL